MSQRSKFHSPSRRHFIGLAGRAGIAAAGLGMLPNPLKKTLAPIGVVDAQAQTFPAPDLYYGGTDGWISLPKAPSILSPSLGLVHPDNLAPAEIPGLSTYIFGFRNLTGMNARQLANQKNKAQHPAPMFWVNEYDPASATRKDFRMQLTNLGLALRPDLFDAHTIHWHGFRNVITFFDGEPTGSVAVTTGRVFQYIYRPRDPGTYMFHCHVEDVEHVHMGMTGPVFVRPKINTATTKYAYNDTSTVYNREFAMFCSEVWCDSHWADAHIQLPEWSDYRVDFALLNGRVYPDTLAPHAPISQSRSANCLSFATVNIPANQPADPTDGDLIAPPGNPHLQFQPMSALVTCNAGERVLLRFVNLGFREAAMTLTNIKMRVVGKDATPMRGRPNGNGVGTDTSYETSTVSFGAGESIDAIFVAPPFSGGSGSSGQGYDVYALYDRAYERANNLALSEPNGAAYGGRRTEVRVYPAGARAAQTLPNTNPGIDTLVA